MAIHLTPVKPILHSILKAAAKSLVGEILNEKVINHAAEHASQKRERDSKKSTVSVSMNNNELIKILLLLLIEAAYGC